MKYHVLKSIAHSFSHSFVSFTNYVDDGYVIDDFRQLARNANGERVSINLRGCSFRPRHLNRYP